MIAPNATANVEIDGKQYNTFTEPPKALAGERAKVQFPVKDMTEFLHGGEENVTMIERLMTELERDPVLNVSGDYDMPKEQLRETAVARIAALSGYWKKDTEKEALLRSQLHGIVDMGTRIRLGVHTGLFMGAIRGSGTKEQYEYWVRKGAAEVKGFYGCFAMTELGHGSNVAGLETTATYIQDTDEFVINTPNTGATKWWIGGAAHSATHTACFARLIVDGKDYGVKIFVVQLRDINSHSLMPGIALGDIGKKMGRDAIDNGWIQFTNVRVPRQNMLMKYAKVSSTGKVSQPPLAQLTYGALIGGRVTMIADSFFVSQRFITIALRYACVRRQFGTTPGQPETKIIDYPYHQRRLLPLLAFTYAMKMAADQSQIQYDQTTDLLQTIDPKDKGALGKAIVDLKELFASSAGLKAFTTWTCANIIDQCRQACGGHGYSGYNGFGQAYADWVVQCTWEGDNNVLCLSMGRGLIQSCLGHRKGKPLGSSVGYLANKGLESATLNGRDLKDPKVLIEAWEKVANGAIQRATTKFVELTKGGLSPDQAFEELSQQRFQCAKIHTRKHLVTAFYERINASAKADVKPYLINLANLFTLWSIEEDSGLFLREGFLQPKDIDQVTELVNHYCKEVRDQVAGYTDAFGLSDWFINAPIGNYDGDVYKHYFAKVNQQNPATNPRPPYYESTLRPFLFREDEDDDVCELDEE
ncbi:Acyl-coenzyme A oxidase 3 [Yarrowia sp. C11]|nr:Acyl-coenzyme A oxidase 3 [Yarrowia sp. E02]KAG5367777.1 Acyl-coenzyme A oxidase 3 [Yarrowia sp. C11]